MKVGITLTSSLEVGQDFIDLTEEVGRSLARQGIGVVYGGTAYGMMATLADSYKEANGINIIGVMAEDLMKVTKGYVAYEGLDQSYVERNMEDRKRKIIDLSDAFLILPGGYGTFEEIGTIIGGRVNKLFDKPIVILNFKGFYDTLVAFLKEIHSKKFSKIGVDQFVYVCDDIEEAIVYFQNYKQTELADKFVR